MSKLVSFASEAEDIVPLVKCCRKCFRSMLPLARLLWWRRGRVLTGLSRCVWLLVLRLTLWVLRLRSAPIGLRVLL
nr:MAG TPA: hypothetical protein [Caudoviricetes sp.]